MGSHMTKGGVQNPHHLPPACFTGKRGLTPICNTDSASVEHTGHNLLSYSVGCLKFQNNPAAILSPGLHNFTR